MFPSVCVAGHTLVPRISMCWCLGWLSLPAATQNSSKQNPEQESNPRVQSFSAAGFFDFFSDMDLFELFKFELFSDTGFGSREVHVL